jgi:hypothetical protein
MLRHDFYKLAKVRKVNQRDKFKKTASRATRPDPKEFTHP